MPTIRPKDINFGSESFSAVALTFAYDAITSIRFEYVVYKHYPQMVTLHHPRLEFYVENNPTSVKIGRKLLQSVGMAEESARSVVSVYEELSRCTFCGRLARYDKQIEETGGFTYDGKRLMKDGSVLSLAGKPIMNLREKKLFRFPDRIECDPRDGAMSRVARFVPMIGQTIHTRFDRDVFLSLLDGLYGIRW